jgi:hypothetical protein
VARQVRAAVSRLKSQQSLVDDKDGSNAITSAAIAWLVRTSSPADLTPKTGVNSVPWSAVMTSGRRPPEAFSSRAATCLPVNLDPASGHCGGGGGGGGGGMATSSQTGV